MDVAPSGTGSVQRGGKAPPSDDHWFCVGTGSFRCGDLGQRGQFLRPCGTGDYAKGIPEAGYPGSQRSGHRTGAPGERIYLSAIYGDPAILLPLIYPGRRPEKKKKYVVIDHYMKRKTTGDDRLSIRTGDYRTFLDKILEAEVVYSSSLHGIILAESYGVPSVFLRQGMEEEMLKYYDWYFATGRYEVRSATSLAEAKETEPMKLPELEELRDGLLQSFPYDRGSARKPEGESVNEKDPKCRQKCDLRRTPEGVSDSGSFYHAHAADPVSGNGISGAEQSVYFHTADPESGGAGSRECTGLQYVCSHRGRKKDEICALLSLYRRYYRPIGLGIFLAGIVLLPFLPSLVKTDSIPPDVDLYVLYLLHLGACVISYWLFAYKNSLLAAHQRSDLANKADLAVRTLQYLIQAGLLVGFRNYYWYLLAALGAQILTNLCTALVAQKNYPDYVPKGQVEEQTRQKSGARSRTCLPPGWGWSL